MKKLIVLALAVVLVLAMATTAFATTARGYGYGACPGGGWGWMWGEDGKFLDKDAFEARVDEAVEAGEVTAEDKEYLMEMYDWCIANGYGDGRGMGRGGCRGRGWGGMNYRIA